jgi:hypothetical protein
MATSIRAEILGVMFFAQLLVINTHALQSTETPVTQTVTALDEQKFQLEKDKLEFERQKFEADTKEKKRNFIVSFVQVAGAIIAIGVPIWLAYWQNRNEIKRRRDDEANELVRRREDETLQFQLKAAEIALDASDSSLVAGKAAALVALFPDRLPKDFAASLDQKNVSFGPGREQRQQFLKLLAEHPDNRQFLTDVYGLMWPGDGADPTWNKSKWPTYKWWVELQKYLAAHPTSQKP